jgi:hypothetical protein
MKKRCLNHLLLFVGNYAFKQFYWIFPIGNGLILILLSSITTTAPVSKASENCARLESNCIKRAIGRLSDLLNKTKDGFGRSRKANNVPKSVSAETITRFSVKAKFIISLSVAVPMPSSQT